MLFLSSLLTLILLIWFKSEAILEYGSLLGLKKFLKYDEFYSEKINYLPNNLSYPLFLKLKYGHSFFIRMISCVLCSTTILSLFSSIISSILFNNIMILTTFPIICIIILLLYGVIVNLLKL